jgi:hypothetical protein
MNSQMTGEHHTGRFALHFWRLKVETHILELTALFIRIYGMVAAGAGSVLYLWRLGSQRAKAAAKQEIPAHHGANSGYVTKAEGN